MTSKTTNTDKPAAKSQPAKKTVSAKKTTSPATENTPSTKPVIDKDTAAPAAKIKVKVKVAKQKVIRDSFPFPKQDHEQLCDLKKTSIAAGIEVKKGELVRAGLHLLAKLSVADLRTTLAQVEKIQKH